MSLGVYGDGGSMKGSGIDSIEMEREFTCRSCKWEGEALGYSDDWAVVLYAECPNCKDEMTYDLEAERVSADWDKEPEDWD